jgi:hypothetical protein
MSLCKKGSLGVEGCGIDISFCLQNTNNLGSNINFLLLLPVLVVGLVVKGGIFHEEHVYMP